MHRVNWLLTLLSLTALLVTIERFSPTIKIILQPYSFLRLHEIVQMSVIILIGVIISFFLLREISNNFQLLQNRRGLILALMFVIGSYFYATGNGLHEVASHLFNTFCNVKIIQNRPCGAMFFNDFYTGNIIYFVGFLLVNLSLVLLEIKNPLKKISRAGTLVTVANGILFGLTLIAYAAFDRVLVGFWFLVAAVATLWPVVWGEKNRVLRLPFTLYCLIAYSSSLLATLAVHYWR